MDNFEECGIRWLTASSIACYRDNPAFWVMRYLYGHKPGGSPALARTIAVKEALRLWLYKGDLGAAEDFLDGCFTGKIGAYGLELDDPGVRSEHSSLLALFSLHVQAFRDLQLGFEHDMPPLAMDLTHSVSVDGLDTPFLVAPFAVFRDAVVEVKPGAKCYNDIQERDRLRVALNQKVYPNKMHFIIYASPKRVNPVWAPAGSGSMAWAELVIDAMALQAFIKVAPSREHALAMVPINASHFRWDEAMLIEASKALAITEEKMRAISAVRAVEAPLIGLDHDIFQVEE